MPTKFAFLPSARTPILSHSLPAGASGRRLVAQSIQVVGEGVDQGARIPISAELLAPGDVVALNRNMITRVEPKPGLTGFEPMYMPFVEFADGDFPWRFSLDTGAVKGVKPWVVLIALKADEFTYVDATHSPLPRIEVTDASRSLPDLAQSWAYAHVQVALSESESNVGAAMTGSPLNHFSRLVCPRKLEERQAYTMFVVPAYEAGRLSGLGISDPPQAPDQPAWNAGANAKVLLPVYFQSRFITNAMEDIEAILRRLKPLRHEDVEALGAPPRASAADPGYYAGFSAPGSTFLIQSALQRAETPTPSLDTGNALTDLVTATLGEVIAGETGGDATQNDPLLAIPPYGWRYRPDGAPARANAEQRRWYDFINLDLKFRHAAGLGAETVRRNQEYFAKLAWDQYQEVVEANQQIVRLATAQALIERINVKHAAKLAPDTLLTLAEPIQPYFTAAPREPVSKLFRANGMPASFAARGLRRIAARRTVHTGGTAGINLIPSPSLPGDQTRNPATSSMQRDMFVRPTAAARPVHGLTADVEAGLRPMLATDLFQRLARPLAAPVATRTFASKSISEHIIATLASLPKAKATYTIQGLLPPEQADLRGIWRSPIITTPLAPRLAAFAPESILADASLLPADSVALFEENRMFVEAFIVGANHEMNKELRWREFPTDMRGTIFRRFWERGRSPDDIAGDDVRAIHMWNGTLGEHFAPGDIDKAANLVIVIRSDLIRKLVLPIMVLNEAESTTWEKNKGIDHEPVFFGTLGADVAYYGFDVARDHILNTVRDRAFLVIYEPAGRLRFGLDVATVATRQKRRNTTLESQRFPVRALGRDERAVLMHSRSPQPVPINADSWDDLSWLHMSLSTAGYIDFSRVISIAGQPDYWGVSKTSASLARSFWQRPIAAVLPMKRVL
jgi:hypothetical protein